MVVQVLRQKLGINAVSQSTLLARNFSMTEIWMCCHAHPAAVIKQGDQYRDVPNTEQQSFSKERVRYF